MTYVVRAMIENWKKAQSNATAAQTIIKAEALPKDTVYKHITTQLYTVALLTILLWVAKISVNNNNGQHRHKQQFDCEQISSRGTIFSRELRKGLVDTPPLFQSCADVNESSFCSLCWLLWTLNSNFCNFKYI